MGVVPLTDIQGAMVNTAARMAPPSAFAGGSYRGGGRQILDITLTGTDLVRHFAVILWGVPIIIRSD